MKNLSVVIATFNEEKNLPKCLDSVKNLASEIIIIDAGSTDGTVNIAKEYNAKVVITDNPAIFHINKQKGLDIASREWILQLDADEVVTDSLKEEIIKTLEQNNKEANGYYIPRKNYFLGKWMRKGGLYPDYVLRLIRRGKARFPCKNVHEQIAVVGKTALLKNPLLHYSYLKLKDYFIKANRYTSLTAADLKSQGIKPRFESGFRYCFLIPVKTFINIYIRHQGFRDGVRGFIWAILSSTHHIFAYIKLSKM